MQSDAKRDLRSADRESIPDVSGAKSNNEYAKARDKALRAWLKRGNLARAQDFVDAKFFPNLDKARKRLRKLAGRNLVRRFGYATFGKRPELVFGIGPSIEAPRVQHETTITRILTALDPHDYVRGRHVGNFRPDAEILLDAGEPWMLLEWDGSTMSSRQIKSRMALLSEFAGDILWICGSPERREWLRRQATTDAMWFALLEEVLTQPRGDLWINRRDELSSL